MRRHLVDDCDAVDYVDVHVYDEVEDSNDDDEVDADDNDHDGGEVDAAAHAERISESVPNLSEYSNRPANRHGPGQRPTTDNATGRFVRSSAMRAGRLREKSAPRTTVTSKPPPFADRPKSSSAVQLLLAEREMPITRERYSRSPRRAASNKAASFDSGGAVRGTGEPVLVQHGTKALATATTAATTAAERHQPMPSSGGGAGAAGGLAVGGSGLRPPSHSDVPRRRSSKDAQKMR